MARHVTLLLLSEMNALVPWWDKCGNGSFDKLEVSLYPCSVLHNHNKVAGIRKTLLPYFS